MDKRVRAQAQAAFSRGPLPPRAMPTLARPGGALPASRLNPEMRAKLLQLSEDAKTRAAADTSTDASVPPGILRLCKKVSVSVKKEMTANGTRLSNIYALLDVESTKRVTLDQFAVGLTNLGVDMTPAEVQELFAYVDGRSKGYLTMADFGKIFAPFRKKVADPFARRVSSSSLSAFPPPSAGDKQ